VLVVALAAVAVVVVAALAALAVVVVAALAALAVVFLFFHQLQLFLILIPVVLKSPCLKKIFLVTLNHL
jgi:hypothetical protein